jgi:hypothetical protein
MVVVRDRLASLCRLLLSLLTGGQLLASLGLRSLSLVSLLSEFGKTGRLRALLLASRQFLLPLLGLLGGCSDGFMSTLGLTGQDQAGGFHYVVLHMEQVGRMVGTEVLFGVRDEGFGLIAGDLTNGYRPSGQPLVETDVPCFRIAPGCILFQQQEVGNGFDGHQTDLRMKGFIFADGDLAWRHLGGQLLLLLLAELGQQRFQPRGKVLLGAVGSGQEFVEFTEFEEPADAAQATVIGLCKDQMQGDQQTM